MIIPRYISLEMVKNRLFGKVNFIGENAFINYNFKESDENIGLTDNQLADFINQAVSEVELTFSPLYVIPFVTTEGLDYSHLPSSTKDLLNSLFINRSCALILQTQFAIDTGVKGENFIKQLDDQWLNYIDKKLLKRNPEGNYLYPALLGLLINTDQYDLSAPVQAPVKVCGGKNDALAFANRHLNNPAQKLWYPFASYNNE